MKVACWTRAVAWSLPKTFPRKSLPEDVLFYAAGMKGVYALRSDPDNVAACVNEACRRINEGLLVSLPPDLLTLEPDWLKDLMVRAEKYPDDVFFYGDYQIRRNGSDQLQKVREDIGDITEREDWGPVWAVRADWLNSVGGLDEANGRAGFYDLLLKSWKRRRHTGASLAVVSPPPEQKSDKKEKLFFPGRGALGGFSYLFMDPEEENQIERVFESFLKREGAFLAEPRSAVPPQAEAGDPLVSVITPVYNRAPFIGKAIESVRRSTIDNWEYLIIDNGSTDGTQDVVRRYTVKDTRITLLENNKNVIALSLNLGVRQAQGKYVAQLDSDDEYLPQTLERMTTALESHPTWGLAISFYALMDEAGNALPEFGVIRHERYNRNNILRRDGAGALRCWHRSVIEEFGGFDVKDLGHYGEDYDLVLKAGEKYEVGRVPEVLYRYRRHADNTDVLRDPEMKIKNKTLARQRAIERRKKLNK